MGAEKGTRANQVIMLVTNVSRATVGFCFSGKAAQLPEQLQLSQVVRSPIRPTKQTETVSQITACGRMHAKSSRLNYRDRGFGGLGSRPDLVSMQGGSNPQSMLESGVHIFVHIYIYVYMYIVHIYIYIYIYRERERHCIILFTIIVVLQYNIKRRASERNAGWTHQALK